MKPALSALLIAIAALPASALAGNTLSYTYLEGGYLRADLDALDDAPDGWQLAGAFDLGANFFLFGERGRVDAEQVVTVIDGPVNMLVLDVDVDTTTFGVGYHHALSERTDLVTRLAYWNVDFGHDDIDGGQVEVGVRSQLADRFEGWAFAGYRDDNSGIVDGGYAKLGGQFELTPRWGLVAELETTSDDQRYFIGPRLSF